MHPLSPMLPGRAGGGDRLCDAMQFDVRRPTPALRQCEQQNQLRDQTTSQPQSVTMSKVLGLFRKASGQSDKQAPATPPAPNKAPSSGTISTGDSLLPDRGTDARPVSDDAIAAYDDLLDGSRRQASQVRLTVAAGVGRGQHARRARSLHARAKHYRMESAALLVVRPTCAGCWRILHA